MAEWYYMNAGEKQGPVSTRQLKQLAATGELQPDDKIWREGLAAWAKASQAKGLFEGPKPPPLPLHHADSPTNEWEDPQATPFSDSNCPDACPLCNRPHKGKIKELYGTKICKKCYYAFISRRQLAFVVDYLLYVSVCVFLLDNLLDNSSGKVLSASIQYSVALLFCLKDGFLGFSPGKALFGVQTLMEDTGLPAEFGASFKRNICLLIPFMIFVVAIQLDKGTRTGDGWAKTKVIWKKYRDHPIFAVG